MRNDRLNDLKAVLTSIVGKNQIYTSERKTRSYRTGIRVGLGNACAVVRPKTLLQLWRVAQTCILFDKILILQAANTSLTGGSTPDGNDYDRDVVIINTIYLDKIAILNKGKQIIAFPGASLFSLEKLLKKYNREPHSIIGSSCIGASIVGGICNNSGGNLINRGPAYTELSVFIQQKKTGELEIVNHLGFNLGETPEEIICNLEEMNFTSDNEISSNSSYKASDENYTKIVRDITSGTPARFNADKRCLYESSGCAGKIIVLAVRLDTFEKCKKKKLFYVGTNSPNALTTIRKNILTEFEYLPEMTEYMHYSSFDGAERYGKDIFLIIKFFGKEVIPKLFKFKQYIDYLFGFLLPHQTDILDIFLYRISRILPGHLPRRIKCYRTKYKHFLIILSSKENIEETNQMLDMLNQSVDNFDFFQATDTEAKDILLHRFVAGLAPKKFQLINKDISGSLLPLDIALPRNCDEWSELIDDELLANSEQSFQMAHFMCMVFHWDFVLKKDVDPETLKAKFLERLTKIGAKYPAEHNVGHFYEAEEDLSNFYKALDPINSFNAGIGKLSKNKYYKETESTCN